MRFKFATVALALGICSVAHADPIADFYRGRSISLILSAGAGGGYASYAQAFAPYFSAHIPGNPNIVIQNMPGGGGIRAMLYLNSVAPKDGTTLGLVHSSVPFAPLYGTKSASFDPRAMNWIGSIDASTGICVSLAHLRHRHLAGHAGEAIHGRQHRRGVADGNDAAHARQSVRHENQSHCRLCGRQRHLFGDGAGRGSGPLRRPHLLDPVNAPRLVPAEEDQRPDSDRADA